MKEAETRGSIRYTLMGFVLGFVCATVILTLLMPPRIKEQTCDIESLNVATVKLNIEELVKEKSFEMQLELMKAFDMKKNEAQYWLEKGISTEELVLDEETYNPFNNSLPVVTFSDFKDLPISTSSDNQIQKPSKILHFKDADSVTLHFLICSKPIFDNMEIITIISPSGKALDIVKDTNNEDYYYINLEEEGYYLVEYRVWQDEFEEKNFTMTADSAIYWMK